MIHPTPKAASKSLIQAAFFGPNANTSTPVFPHISPLLFEPCTMGAACGAIPCPAIREERPPTDRAGPRFRGRAFGGQRRLQHRIIGQNGIPEVAAVCARPAFPQHIAGAVQRQAPILPIIIRTQGKHQLADRPLFLAGQFPAHTSSSSQGGVSSSGSSKASSSSP